VISNSAWSLLLGRAPGPRPFRSRQPGRSGHQSKDEAAVLAAMDRYLTAISARDLKTLHEMADARVRMTWRARAAEAARWRFWPRPPVSYWDRSGDDAGTKLTRAVLDAGPCSSPGLDRGGLGPLRVLAGWKDQSLRRGCVRFS